MAQVPTTAMSADKMYEVSDVSYASRAWKLRTAGTDEVIRAVVFLEDTV